MQPQRRLTRDPRQQQLPFDGEPPAKARRLRYRFPKPIEGRTAREYVTAYNAINRFVPAE